MQKKTFTSLPVNVSLRCVVFVFQFSQLLQLRQRLGTDSFPLIDQSYFPSHKEMVSADNAAILYCHFSDL